MEKRTAQQAGVDQAGRADWRPQLEAGVWWGAGQWAPRHQPQPCWWPTSLEPGLLIPSPTRRVLLDKTASSLSQCPISCKDLALCSWTCNIKQQSRSHQNWQEMGDGIKFSPTSDTWGQDQITCTLPRKEIGLTLSTILPMTWEDEPGGERVGRCPGT